ncbi:hypothetical protein NQ315_012437 [Exocentrus adspersus]|uniref:DUF4817 domain-containing protein n=1 Tax=Exocentrus adspersus TaxID=1586481 RepID=A0AAV8VMT2_9CUCU|nr:hypothetical protein NQ315_012437 [Exocentrus adspersus]
MIFDFSPDRITSSLLRKHKKQLLSTYMQKLRDKDKSMTLRSSFMTLLPYLSLADSTQNYLLMKVPIQIHKTIAQLRMCNSFSIKSSLETQFTDQMHLSERERITLLMIRGYGDRIRSYEEAANLFNDTFPNRPPIAKSTVQKTVRRFEQFGFIKDNPRTGRPKSETNEEKSVEVMQSFIENKYISIPKAAQEHGISTFSVHRILKLCKFHPYKVHLIQQLTEDDFDRRVVL